MSDMQLSFLSAEAATFDINAVDDGVIRDSGPYSGSAALFLSQRPVDDCVFGLGFTNWKALIDHALRSGHFELFSLAESHIGLRKHGFRHAPIPRLPPAGVTYVLQRLLSLAADRSVSLGRHDKMVSVGNDVSHKVVLEKGLCWITVKQGNNVVRTSASIELLAFSDTAKNDPDPIAIQVERLLCNAGAVEDMAMRNGCRSIASHILRIAHGVR